MPDNEGFLYFHAATLKTELKRPNQTICINLCRQQIVSLHLSGTGTAVQHFHLKGTH